jgi:hypothetical protein
MEFNSALGGLILKHNENMSKLERMRREENSNTKDLSSDKVKVKVKCTLVQALTLCTGRMAHRGSRGIALLFLDYGIRRGEGSASRPGRSLPPGNIRYPLCRKLGGPQGWFGQVRKISPPTRIRSPDRPARSSVAFPTELPSPLAVKGSDTNFTRK